MGGLRDWWATARQRRCLKDRHRRSWRVRSSLPEAETVSKIARPETGDTEFITLSRLYSVAASVEETDGTVAFGVTPFTTEGP